jgi:uncharacterized protein with NRDE domain
MKKNISHSMIDIKAIPGFPEDKALVCQEYGMGKEVQIGEFYGNMRQEVLVLRRDGDYFEVIERVYGESLTERYFVLDLVLRIRYPYLVVEITNFGE